ncbi:MAG: mucoidy inhibitor MuiA family protein [Candidatus Thorarchaeota archaeon]
MATELKTQIGAVTVFRDGARVTRNGKQKVGAGEQTLLISGITGYAEEDSFRVKGKGAAVLKGIDVSRKQVIYEPEGNVEELREELEKLRKDEQKINDRMSFYKSKIEHLQAIASQFSAEFGKWFAAGESSIEHLTKMDESTISSIQDLKKKLRKELEKLEALKAQIRVVSTNLSKVEGQRRTETVTEVSVLVDAKQETEISLELVYQLSDAGWNPTYDVDLKEKTSSVKRIAMIQNTSREDWEDVSLTVSTASAQPVSIVRPQPYYVDISSPYPETSSSIGDGLGGGAAFFAARVADMDDLEGLAEEPMDERYAVATESLSGTVIYEVPGKITIISEKEPHPVTLTEEEFESRRIHYWNAYAMQEVVAQDEVTNGDSVLLPGNVKVYAAGDFIGETYLAMIAPRETFRLGTRAAYDLKAEKKLVEKDTEKAGITRGKRRRDYKYKLEIKSFAKDDVEIKIVDRIPYSSSEKVTVELEEPTLVYKKMELGVIEWETKIKPNEELNIEYSFEVQWDKELRIRPPLP